MPESCFFERIAQKPGRKGGQESPAGNELMLEGETETSHEYEKKQRGALGGTSGEINSSF